MSSSSGQARREMVPGIGATRASQRTTVPTHSSIAANNDPSQAFRSSRGGLINGTDVPWTRYLARPCRYPVQFREKALRIARRPFRMAARVTFAGAHARQPAMYKIFATGGNPRRLFTRSSVLILCPRVLARRGKLRASGFLPDTCATATIAINSDREGQLSPRGYA